MAYTHSYIADNNRIMVDDACFAALQRSSTAIIIIEKHKFSLERPFIEEYLNDLKQYFDFDITFNEEKQEFHVDITKITHSKTRILIGTFLRFIWEGFYKLENTVIDLYYKILPIYFKYKKYYTKMDRMKLLLVACNWYLLQIKENKEISNSNHFINLNTYYCKIDSEIVKNFKSESIHDVFKSKLMSDVKPYQGKISNMKTKKEFCDFFNFINNLENEKV